jgi:hypothetical protein
MGRPTYCSGKVGKCTGLHPRKGGAAHRGNTAGRSAMGAEIRPCHAPASSPARGQRGSQPRGEQGPAWSSSMKKKSPARWGEKLPAAERRGEWGAPCRGGPTWWRVGAQAPTQFSDFSGYPFLFIVVIKAN